MYNASSKYKTGIYATSRMNKGRVTFDISDVTAAGDVASITTTSESSLSKRADLVDKIRNSSFKFATLEKDRFALDGNWTFADDTLANNGEIGWASETIGSADGAFFNNILGSDGDCEDISKWSTFQSSQVLDSSNVKYGNNSIKVSASVIGYASTGKGGLPLTNGKKYIAIAEFKNGNAPYVAIEITPSLGVSNGVTDGSGFNVAYKKFVATATVGINLYTISTVTGQYFYVDGVRIYELTDAEYTAIDTMTPAQIAVKYPYQELAPQIAVAFNSDHSSIGLTVSFDPMNNEYATDFIITAYNSSNAVIASYPYTGNTKSQVAAQGQLTNYRKVTVTITKWSVPNRRCRVSEVDFGVVKVYTGETGLVSMSLTEEMDLTSASIVSPEFSFKVDNSSREFNILSPTGFYKSLQQKQQVLGEIGLVNDDGTIEWIPVGNYQLSEWQSDEGALTSTFIARTKLDQMASVYYENLTPISQSLYNGAVVLFNMCGITNYWIDPALQNITINSLIKKQNCKDILQMIAIAGCANVYVTRDNVITIKTNRTRKVRYIRDWSNGSNVNAGNFWVEIQALNASGTNIALGKPVTGSSAFNSAGSPNDPTGAVITDGSTVSAPYTQVGGATLEWATVDLGAVYDIADVKIWHYWADLRTFYSTKTEVSADGINWITVFDSAVSGTYAESAAGRSYSMETAPNNASPVDTISMNDQYAEPKIVLENPVKQVQVSYYTDLNTAVPVTVNSLSTVGDTLKLEGNTLINTSVRATAVANWIIAQKNNRATYTANWRGNQAHEQGDVVSIGNSYGVTAKAYITKTELKYEGYVQATTEAKGVVN